MTHHITPSARRLIAVGAAILTFATYSPGDELSGKDAPVRLELPSISVSELLAIYTDHSGVEVSVDKAVSGRLLNNFKLSLDRS